MISFPTVSKDIICKYIDSGYLPQNVLINILKAENNQEIIESLSELFNITAENEGLIWDYIRNNVWNINDPESLFDIKDDVFLYLLLKNKGIMLKKEILNAKIKPIKTYDLLTSTEKKISKHNIIDIYHLKNHEVVYVLNIKFYREVFGNE